MKRWKDQKATNIKETGREQEAVDVYGIQILMKTSHFANPLSQVVSCTPKLIPMTFGTSKKDITQINLGNKRIL